MDGWIKFHRKILDNPLLANDDNAYIVFTKLLLMVNRETGIYATGRKKLAEKLHMNDRTLYGILKRLERADMIELLSNSRFTEIAIKQWKLHQNRNTSGNTRKTGINERQANIFDNRTATTAQQQRNRTATLNNNRREKRKEITKIVEENPGANRRSESGQGIEALRETMEKIKAKKFNKGSQ